MLYWRSAYDLDRIQSVGSQSQAALRLSYEDVSMSTVNVKEEAKRLIERLPENITWDDLMHEIYVRQSIDSGLVDSKAGRLTDVNEVRSKFRLP